MAILLFPSRESDSNKPELIIMKSSSAAARSRTGSEIEKREESMQEKIKVRAFPNPFKEKLTVDVKTPTQEPALIGLLDLTGKEIHRSTGLTNTSIEIEKCCPIEFTW